LIFCCEPVYSNACGHNISTSIFRTQAKTDTCLFIHVDCHIQIDQLRSQKWPIVCKVLKDGANRIPASAYRQIAATQEVARHILQGANSPIF